MKLEHGEFELILSDDIFFMKLIGSFNEFGVRTLITDARKMVNKLDGKQFGVVVNVLNLEGITPEGYEVLNEANKWLNSENMFGKATINSSKINASIVKNRVSARNNFKNKTFTSEIDALDWLDDMKEQASSTKPKQMF